MNATKLAYPDCDLDHANSLLSGMLNCFFGFGQALGPLIGAFLVQIFSFGTMCNIIGGFVISLRHLYGYPLLDVRPRLLSLLSNLLELQEQEEY